MKILEKLQKKLYNNLEIVLPVQKCVSQNGKIIPKVLYSLFWALNFFLNKHKNKKVNFFWNTLYNLVDLNITLDANQMPFKLGFAQLACLS